MEKKGLLVQMKAKPGKESELMQFLKNAQPLAEKEKNTISWYAIRINENTFGIFDTFSDDEGREGHLKGEIAKALLARVPDLLSQAPSIDKVEILAVKEKEEVSV